MTTMTTPTTSPAVPLPTCPAWCTSAEEAHPWEQNRDGSWSRYHRRQVGSFTISGTQRATTSGSRTVMHPTLADWVFVDTAARAAELSEDLHLVAQLLYEIESRADR